MDWIEKNERVFLLGHMVQDWEVMTK